MGHRLSKIYTKTGDRGMTGLADGTRVAKDDLLCHAMGDVDELNSAIGMLLSYALPTEARTLLTRTQHVLFEIGAELSCPEYRNVKEEETLALETAIDAMNEHLPALKEFILPRGDAKTAWCHVMRSICRRAERQVVSLMDDETMNPASLMFINRLSDYLFVLARALHEGEEILWEHERHSTSL